jgi:hypothetical protein
MRLMADRRTDYDSDCQHYEQYNCQHCEVRDRVCSRLGLGVNRRLNVCRMKAAMVSRARGVVDARSRNSNRAGYPAPAKRHMGAAHSDGDARSGLGQIEGQTRKEVDSAIESKITQFGWSSS